jgi:hypothetical protein
MDNATEETIELFIELLRKVEPERAANFTPVFEDKLRGIREER